MSEHDRLSANLVALATIYAAGHGITLFTVGKHLGHRGEFLQKLQAGDAADFMVSTYDRDVQFFSDHWPENEGLYPWPPAVVRPPRSVA